MNYDKRSAEIKKAYEAQGKDPSGILELRDIFSELRATATGDQVTTAYSRLMAFGKKLDQFPELKPAYKTLRKTVKNVIQLTAEIAKDANDQRLEQIAEVQAEAKKEISAVAKDKEKIRKTYAGKLLYAQLKNETDEINFNALKEELDAWKAKYDALGTKEAKACSQEPEDRIVTIPENSRRFLLYQLGNRLGDLIEKRKAEEAAKAGLPEADLDYLLNEAIAAEDRAEKAEERTKAAEQKLVDQKQLSRSALEGQAAIENLEAYKKLGTPDQIQKNLTDRIQEKSALAKQLEEQKQKTGAEEKKRTDAWNEFFRAYSALKNLGRVEKGAEEGTVREHDKELARIKLELDRCLESIGAPGAPLDYRRKLLGYFVEFTEFKYSGNKDGNTTPEATRKAFEDQEKLEKSEENSKKTGVLADLAASMTELEKKIDENKSPHTNFTKTIRDNMRGKK